MKNDNNKIQDDELREEYDFSSMPGGTKGKYTQQYAQGANIVLLDPDVARAFPTGESVNKALRMLIRVAEESQEDIKRRRKAG
jgi:hypothetical protein